MEGYFNNKNKLTQLLFVKRVVIYLSVGFNGVSNAIGLIFASFLSQANLAIL